MNAPQSAERLYAEAHWLFSCGRVAEAEAAFRRLLKLQPGHFEILHKVALCYLQRGDFIGAVKHLDGAIKVNPKSAPVHLSRGNALWGLKRVTEALRSYDQAAALDPQFFDAHYNRAAALEQLGRFTEALPAYGQALAQRPQDARAQLGRANALAGLGRVDEAIAGYRTAVAVAPNLVDAHANLGAALVHQQRATEALVHLEHALRLNPDHEPASACRHRALLALGREQDALDLLKKALLARPNDAELWQQHGRLLVRMRRASEAIASFDRALALLPSHRSATFGRGLAFAQLGRAEEVLAAFDALLSGQPNDARAMVNRGYALIQLRRYAEGRASIEAGLALDPDQPHARFLLSLVDLTEGDYMRGLEGYEWRLQDPELNLRRVLPAPRWSGREDLTGRSILIHAEQGLGDTVQFCRFVPLISARAERTILEVPDALVELLRRCLGSSVELIARGEAISRFDLHCPLPSLPRALGLTLPTLPEQPPYLWAEPGRCDAWSRRLGTGPWTGLVWSGSSTHENDHNRSIPLSLLKPLLSTGGRFVALQDQVRASDQAALETMPGLEFVGDDFESFEDTAAVISLCEIVITVDTAVAHLAAAMGKPTWVLVPFVPDWRWLLGRTDSPWYPTIRIFRQPALRDWVSVVSQVIAALAR